MFGCLNNYTSVMVSEKMPPGKMFLRRLHPGKLPPGKKPPRKLPPKKIAPQENCPPGKLFR